MFRTFIGRWCHSGVFRIPKSTINDAYKISKDQFKYFKVLFSRRCLLPSTHAYNEYKVGSAGYEHPWNTCCPEETMTRCHTMPEELAFNHIEPSSDDNHMLDGLDQRSPLVD
uniref:Uncharacterized protein n=1 Tax=Tanacetum cinerariifolium TaxID=118510 RepID=A0A6L2N2A0_TANCI|nr:hypothetical protein [Tanacetum cinerariifolium]